jgi:hypothetical protein
MLTLSGLRVYLRHSWQSNCHVQVASALDGLAQDLFADPEFHPIMRHDLADGIHENRTGRLELFTTAKFHRPDELAAEVQAAGLSVLSVVGVEGPGWLFPDFNERWQD